MGWVVVQTMDGLIDVVPRKKARPTMPRLRGTVDGRGQLIAERSTHEEPQPQME